MAIRLLATYEMVDRDDKHVGTVRLPVVGFSEPDPEGRERPRVLLLSGWSRMTAQRLGPISTDRNRSDLVEPIASLLRER